MVFKFAVNSAMPVSAASDLGHAAHLKLEKKKRKKKRSKTQKKVKQNAFLTFWVFLISFFLFRTPAVKSVSD